MNKWKVSFWAMLGVWIFTVVFFLYVFIDNGVTKTYQKDGYAATENDMQALSIITSLHLANRNEIIGQLKKNKIQFNEIDSSTVSLQRNELKFDSTMKLIQIQKNW